MIFHNKFPFILLVMTTSLCCMRLLVSVHASPLGAALKDRAQLNDRGLPYYDPPDHADRIFLGYYYTWKRTLDSEIRDHDGFNALVDKSFVVLIQPSCVFEDTQPYERRNRYVRLQITADRTEFLKLDYLYSSTYLVTEQVKRSFIESRGKDPEKTIIVSPHLRIKQNPKSLNELVLNFPNSFLLPSRESSDKNQNPLQINAEEDQANSEEFVEWRDWPKKIIDLPPGLEPRHPSRPCS